MNDYVRQFWVKATGHQLKNTPVEINISTYDVIDLSNNGEDRWIYTAIQTVDPTNNPVAAEQKWLHLVPYSAYAALKSDNEDLEKHYSSANKEAKDYCDELFELKKENLKQAILLQTLRAELWVAKDSQLRTYDGMAQKADRVDDVEKELLEKTEALEKIRDKQLCDYCENCAPGRCDSGGSLQETASAVLAKYTKEGK